MIHLSMSRQNTNFQSNTVWTFGFMVLKDNPYRPMPGRQKLHFCLAIFHENYDIFKALCRISLKIWCLLNFRVLNQNLVVKNDEFKWKLCYFDVLIRFRISENCQKWSITNGILRMWHSWWSFKSYFWKYILLGNFVSFAVYLCSYICFWFLKTSFKR